jgi:hypothetical protein
MANNVYHSMLVKTGDVQQVLKVTRELIPARGEISLHNGLIKFATAWGTPVEGFERLAARFPDHDIIVHGACMEDGEHFIFNLRGGVAEGRDCSCGGVDSPDYPCATPELESRIVRLTLNQNTSDGALDDEGYPEEVGR